MKIVKVGELREFLKHFDDRNDVTVFLNIVDDNNKYLIGVSFDVEDLTENGSVLQLNITENLEDIKKYVKDAENIKAKNSKKN